MQSLRRLVSRRAEATETASRARQRPSTIYCLPQSVTEGLSQGIQLECIDRKVSQEAVPWYNNGTN